MKKFCWILISGLLPLGLSATPASMTDLGPNALMRGGAYVTGAQDMDAFRSNPAVLAYRFGSSGFGGGWQDLPEAGSSWHISILDGQRRVVNGLHFQWWEQGPLERKSLSLGGAYRTDYGSAGVSTSMFRFGGFEKGNGWQFSTAAGILTPAYHGLVFGVSIKNLVDWADSEVLPPELAMGLNFRQRQFGAYFQADRRFSLSNQKWNFSTGGELIFQEYFAVRGGYRFENSDGPSYFSVGLSVLAPKIDLAAVYLRSTGDQASNGIAFHCLFLF